MSGTTPFDIESPTFQDSPLATAYYNIRAELKERDGRGKASHHRIALWAAWEAHKTAQTEDGTDLLSVVGLPKTQKEMAKVIGVSDRSLRKYAKQYAEYAIMAQDTAVNRLLMRYRLPALHALGRSAAGDTPQSPTDRRTFFTITGDLVTKSQMDANVKETDWRDEVVEMLRDGRISPEDVLDEFEPTLARQLIARAKVEGSK